MTIDQYLEALERLGLELSPYNTETQEVLGKKYRQLYRYKTGETPIPKTIEKLLTALMEKAKCG